MHANTDKAQHFSVSGKLKLRHGLRAFVSRVAGQHAFLPRNLIQVAIGENHDDQPWVASFLPVICNGDHFVDSVHQHRAVTDSRYHDAIRVSKLAAIA
jgi:hypothetical protein